MKTPILILLIPFIVMAKVITYQETFDDVKVIPPAKSTQTICKTRVDLSEGLVDNSRGCDIKEINVYNKNRMWVGSLDGVEEGFHKRYADYDVKRYKGKGTQIEIDYSFTSQDASPSNRWMVSCPKGMFAYIDSDYYYCKKPFTCYNGMYAIDSLECEELPYGAHRNATTGYSCNKGYVMRSEGYCEEKATCGATDAYDKTDNSCHERPDNSHWIKNTLEWECNNGYVLQGDACEKKLKCDSASRYYAEYNTCVALPEFSHWNDSESSDWTCDTGYVLSGDGCVEKATCSSEQRYDESENSCVDPYPNSIWVGDYGNYVCNDGYVDLGDGQCEEKADCLDAHYNKENNSCYEKPANSHWAYTSGSTWVCDEGFVEINEYCEEKVSCGVFERYNETNNTCVNKPSHSHWVSDWEYECDDGYTVDDSGECYDMHPIIFRDYVHFTNEIGMDVGLGFYKDNYDESQVLINTGMDYNIGISIGFENVKVKLHGSVAFLSTILDYSEADDSFADNETIMALLWLYGFNVGFDLWKITLGYSYLFVIQSDLDNISFNNTLHKIRVGFMLNEHWVPHLTVIPNLIKSTTIMKQSHNVCYNIGITYRF